MEVSPNALRKETIQTLHEVNGALMVSDKARVEVIAPLLLAKAQCLNTLTLLNQQGPQSKRRPLPT